MGSWGPSTTTSAASTSSLGVSAERTATRRAVEVEEDPGPSAVYGAEPEGSGGRQAVAEKSVPRTTVRSAVNPAFVLSLITALGNIFEAR
jgi:hypothetical protein